MNGQKTSIPVNSMKFKDYTMKNKKTINGWKSRFVVLFSTISSNKAKGHKQGLHKACFAISIFFRSTLSDPQ